MNGKDIHEHRVISRLYSILLDFIYNIKPTLSWCYFLCSNFWSQEEWAPYKFWSTFSRYSGYLISLWILSQLVNFYKEAGSFFTLTYVSGSWVFLHLWDKLKVTTEIQKSSCCGGRGMENRSKMEGMAPGDRLQGCHGDRLALVGCLLLGCGQIKGTCISHSLTGLFSILWETFSPNWGQTILGLLREDKFVFNPKLILSLIFIHPAWAPWLLIVLETSDSKQIPEN